MTTPLLVFYGSLILGEMHAMRGNRFAAAAHRVTAVIAMIGLGVIFWEEF